MRSDMKNPRPGKDRPNGDDRPAKGERIARRLARAGIASRREAEAMVAAGRVSVNGKILSTPAFNVTDRDRVMVDGQLIPERERTRLFLFHKPAGTVTTNRDPEGRRTVFDVLPEGLPRLMTVGRLDFSTEGLLLMTNDGGLARVLELPSTGWLRRYRVRVHGNVDERALAGLSDGIAVDGVLYGAIEAALDRRQGSNAWLTIALREGKNREVRNVLGALGLEVTRLIRVSYGPFQLGELPEGAIVELKGRTLRDQLGPTLIRDAGADFDAEIRQPFSNKPVAGASKRQPTGEAGKGKRTDKQVRNALSPREDALRRLDTRRNPPRETETRHATKEGEAGRRKRGEAPHREEVPRSRAAHVWRAPGARPVSPKGPGGKDRDPTPGKPERPAGKAGRKPRGRHADRRR